MIMIIDIIQLKTPVRNKFGYYNTLYNITLSINDDFNHKHSILCNCIKYIELQYPIYSHIFQFLVKTLWCHIFFPRIRWCNKSKHTSSSFGGPHHKWVETMCIDKKFRRVKISPVSRISNPLFLSLVQRFTVYFKL